MTRQDMFTIGCVLFQIALLIYQNRRHNNAARYIRNLQKQIAELSLQRAELQKIIVEKEKKEMNTLHLN